MLFIIARVSPEDSEKKFDYWYLKMNTMRKRVHREKFLFTLVGENAILSQGITLVLFSSFEIIISFFRGGIDWNEIFGFLNIERMNE